MISTGEIQAQVSFHSKIFAGKYFNYDMIKFLPLFSQTTAMHNLHQSKSTGPRGFLSMILAQSCTTPGNHFLSLGFTFFIHKMDQKTFLDLSDHCSDGRGKQLRDGQGTYKQKPTKQSSQRQKSEFSFLCFRSRTASEPSQGLDLH